MNIENIKVRQLLAKNIDDFKFLVLKSMRLEENRASKSLHAERNRISDLQDKTESLEEWVVKEFAPKSFVQKEQAEEVPGEKLEQWVARQKIRPVQSRTSRTILDVIEQWLMNEAKKDLFAAMDAECTGSKELSSRDVRELGLKLIILADKLDKIKK